MRARRKSYGGQGSEESGAPSVSIYGAPGEDNGFRTIRTNDGCLCRILCNINDDPCAELMNLDVEACDD